MLSTNCAKASRVDQSKLSQNGELGLRFKNELLIKKEEDLVNLKKVDL